MEIHAINLLNADLSCAKNQYPCIHVTLKISSEKDYWSLDTT